MIGLPEPSAVAELPPEQLPAVLAQLAALQAAVAARLATPTPVEPHGASGDGAALDVGEVSRRTGMSVPWLYREARAVGFPSLAASAGGSCSTPPGSPAGALAARPVDFMPAQSVKAWFMPTRTRIGRPPEIPDRVEIVVYLSRSERAAIRRAAQRADVSTSAWVRAVALAALKDRTGRTP